MLFPALPLQLNTLNNADNVIVISFKLGVENADAY